MLESITRHLILHKQIDMQHLWAPYIQLTWFECFTDEKILSAWWAQIIGRTAGIRKKSQSSSFELRKGASTMNSQSVFGLRCETRERFLTTDIYIFVTTFPFFNKTLEEERLEILGILRFLCSLLFCYSTVFIGLC